MWDLWTKLMELVNLNGSNNYAIFFTDLKLKFNIFFNYEYNPKSH